MYWVERKLAQSIDIVWAVVWRAPPTSIIIIILVHGFSQGLVFWSHGFFSGLLFSSCCCSCAAPREGWLAVRMRPKSRPPNPPMSILTLASFSPCHLSLSQDWSLLYSSLFSSSSSPLSFEPPEAKLLSMWLGQKLLTLTTITTQFVPAIWAREVKKRRRRSASQYKRESNDSLLICLCVIWSPRETGSERIQ